MSVDVLFDAGDDALGHEFEMLIPDFPGAKDIGATVLRITNMTTPDTEVGTYDVQRKGQTVPKPNGVDASPKEFTFTMRIDKYYKIYTGIRAWNQIFMNKETGEATSDTGGANRREITVYGVNSAGVVTNDGWVFEGCFPNIVPGVAFDVAATDPQTVDITIKFIKERYLGD